MKPNPLSLRLAFNFAWPTFQKHVGLFTALMLTLFGAWVALEIVVIAGQSLGPGWWLVAHGLFFVVFAGLEVGFIQICLALHAGRAVTFSAVFAGFGSSAVFLVGQALYGVMVLAGLALFIIPGLYWGTCYAFYGFYLVPHSPGLVASFQRSARLSQGTTMALLAFLMFQVLLNLLGASLLGLGLLVTVPLSMLMLTSAYHQLGRA